jgi:nucleoside-diphosphate-sugar epimerase
MRVFVAGAAGAIGQPLIAELVRQGHTVTGMTHSEAGARKFVEMGAVSDRLVSCPQGKKLGRDLGTFGARCGDDLLTHQITVRCPFNTRGCMRRLYGQRTHCRTGGRWEMG